MPLWSLPDQLGLFEIKTSQLLHLWDVKIVFFKLSLWLTLATHTCNTRRRRWGGGGEPVIYDNISYVRHQRREKRESEMAEANGGVEEVTVSFSSKPAIPGEAQLWRSSIAQ